MFLYLVDNADLEPVCVPGHAPDHRLVSVVNHLLIPAALVQHPHDNQAVLERTIFINLFMWKP